MRRIMSFAAAVVTLAVGGMASAQVCGSGGSCFEQHGPGCNDVDCCSAVCAIDPFCCNNSWDSLCVEEAGTECATCGGPGAGSCYSTGSPYCNDTDCCNAVCAYDPFCCNTSWDSLCVEEAFEFCAACGGSGAGDCYTPGGTYCNDADCCNAVCAYDPFCCESSWDSLCVEEAFDLCAVCGGTGSGDCFTPGAPYCNDSYCCESVCAADPFCCNTSWDSLCVDAAYAMCTCGGEDTHSCFSSGGPYCNDADCCNAVCAVDPFCCNNTWDSLCVSGAGTLCATCGGAGAGSCFEQGGTYCNDADCCNAVCAADPFCCNTSWDSFCVEEAIEMCASCGGSATHSCFIEGGPACANGACCNVVCAADPFCCNVQWDSICVTEAFEMCLGCGEPDAGSCFVPHGSPACNDSACCQTVCTVDPFCCVNQWDSLCAGEAADMCAQSCPADLNGDGQVGPADLALLLGAWNTPAGDLNGDGSTGSPDLALLLGAWGPC